MRLTYPDYIVLVKAAYKTIQTTGEKPLLVNPTPSSVRKECITLLQERLEKKDEPALRAFFGSPDSAGKFLSAIEQFETERFKAFQKYLNGKTATTDQKNVELLAWLIGFKHRPYRLDNHVILTHEEKAILLESKPGEEAGFNEQEKPAEELLETEPIPEPVSKDPVSTANEKAGRSVPRSGNRSIKQAAVVLMIAAVCSGGLYAIKKVKDKSQCMYWAVDHYESISCDEEISGSFVIALNEKVMKTLKKITREDTITSYSVGRLFYIKENNDIQYYTAGGNYPADLNRSLKKLSQNIFDKDSLNRKLTK